MYFLKEHCLFRQFEFLTREAFGHRTLLLANFRYFFFKNLHYNVILYSTFAFPKHPT